MKKILPVALVVGVISLVACAGLNSCSLTVETDGLRVIDASLDVQPKHVLNPKNVPVGYSLSAGTYVFNSILDLSSFTAGDTFTFNFSSGVSDYSSLRFAYFSGGDDNVLAEFPSIAPNRIYYYWAVGDSYDNAYSIDSGWSGTFNSIYLAEDSPDLGSTFYDWVISNSTYTADSSSSSSESSNDAYNSGYSAGYSEGYSEGYEEGSGDGYHEGAVDGYSEGYASGYSAGAVHANDLVQDITVYFVDNSYSFDVSVSDGNAVVASQTLSTYAPYVNVRRSVDQVLYFRFTSSNTDYPYFHFRVVVDDNEFFANSTYITNDYIYMPTWYSRVLVYVTTTNDPMLSLCDALVFDPYSFEDVYIANDVFLDGYSKGYEDGKEGGYGEGYEEGWNEGRSDGYANGYQAGRADVNNEGQAMNNLFGALVDIPINVLNGLMPLTIWSTPILAILFSFLFLGIVIWIVRKFI